MPHRRLGTGRRRLPDDDAAPAPSEGTGAAVWGTERAYWALARVPRYSSMTFGSCMSDSPVSV